MAISINPATYVITIPKTDTAFVETNATTGYEVRSYDEYALMRELADYMDSEAGVALPNAFSHATQATISGIIYARSLLFLAPYTITFESGAYQVKLVGGTNNNMLDVLNPNNVSVISANSAGLQQITAGSVIAPTQQQIRDAMALDTAATPAAGSIDSALAAIPADVLAAAQVTPIQSISQDRIIEGALTEAEAQRIMLSALAGKVVKSGTNIKFKSVNGLTDRIDGTVDDLGNRTAVTLDGG